MRDPLKLDPDPDPRTDRESPPSPMSQANVAQATVSQATVATSSYRPDLPDWGVYLTWPTEGHSWIHASDLSAALKLIPSRRIFQRTRWDNTFYQLRYGTISIRVRPTLWLRVESLDLNVGQQVELLSHHGENDAGICTVEEILFRPGNQQVEYFLRRGSMTLTKSFGRSDLKPLRVTHKLRSGYFPHQPPCGKLPADIELLNVGDLTGD